MRLIWTTVITGVDERKLTVGGKRSADGTAELFTESGGWYIRLGNISLYTGDVRPDFQQGDRVTITLEKERTNGNEDD